MTRNNINHWNYTAFQIAVDLKVALSSLQKWTQMNTISNISIEDTFIAIKKNECLPTRRLYSESTTALFCAHSQFRPGS